MRSQKNNKKMNALETFKKVFFIVNKIAVRVLVVVQILKRHASHYTIRYNNMHCLLDKKSRSTFRLLFSNRTLVDHKNY